MTSRRSTLPCRRRRSRSWGVWSTRRNGRGPGREAATGSTARARRGRASDGESEIQRRGREPLLDVNEPRGEALLVRVGRERLQYPALAGYSVRQRVPGRDQLVVW